MAFSGEKRGLCLACDAACRWMRGTLRAQVRARSFRTARLGDGPFGDWWVGAAFVPEIVSASGYEFI